ncbi:MAG: hypothetical protein ACI4O7_07055 [Aristaeellaceae bacterium]
MMKRFWCLMLCLALALTSSCALAAEEYTLPEKLQMQIEFGNGVKGAVALTASGEGDLAKALSVLNGTEIQIRAITLDGTYQTSLYALDGETQLGLTQVYGDGENVYLRSELLPELVLSYPLGEDWLERLMGRTGEDNPTWYSVASNLLSLSDEVWEAAWAPALQPYTTQLEMWLSGYASEPVVNQGEQGETLMSVRYTVPAQDVKEEIKTLLVQALSDEGLMGLLRAQMTEEQAAVYLTPGLMYYYEAVIDALPLDGEITMERDLSTRGETISTAVSLPLPAESRWQEMSLEQGGGDTALTLTGAENALTLVLRTASATESSAVYTGLLRLEPEEGQGLAAAFNLKKVFSHTVDDDTREHDMTTWTLDVTMDESVAGDGDYVVFEPIHATLMTHFHSKNAKRNATTLELTASLTQGTESLSLAGSIKTTSPWVLDQLPTEGAEDLTAMTESYRSEILGMMWANLQSVLSALHPGELPAPEEDEASADAADEEEPAGAADPTVVPAEEEAADSTAEPTATPTAVEAEPSPTATTEPTAIPTAEAAKPSPVVTVQPTATATAEDNTADNTAEPTATTAVESVP